MENTEVLRNLIGLSLAPNGIFFILLLWWISMKRELCRIFGFIFKGKWCVTIWLAVASLESFFFLQTDMFGFLVGFFPRRIIKPLTRQNLIYSSSNEEGLLKRKFNLPWGIRQSEASRQDNNIKSLLRKVKRKLSQIVYLSLQQMWYEVNWLNSSSKTWIDE